MKVVLYFTTLVSAAAAAGYAPKAQTYEWKYPNDVSVDSNWVDGISPRRHYADHVVNAPPKITFNTVPDDLIAQDADEADPSAGCFGSFGGYGASVMVNVQPVYSPPCTDPTPPEDEDEEVQGIQYTPEGSTELKNWTAPESCASIEARRDKTVSAPLTPSGAQVHFRHQIIHTNEQRRDR